MLRDVGIFVGGWWTLQSPWQAARMQTVFLSVCLPGKGNLVLYTTPFLSLSHLRHSQATTWSVGYQHRLQHRVRKWELIMSPWGT